MGQIDQSKKIKVCVNATKGLFYYTGRIINDDADFLTLLDDNGHTYKIGKPSIVVIELMESA